MKQICITFDDGRENNIRYALPILERYNLPATFFITTGYIDGSWVPVEGTWRSAGKPMKTGDIIRLAQSGKYELALHGDRHKMEPGDFVTAKRKMDTWLGEERRYGFSIPNSHYSKDDYDFFTDKCGDAVKYIRKGSSEKSGIVGKLRKAARVYSGSNAIFNGFYKQSIITGTDVVNPLPSVGIRRHDRPDMISGLIKSAPDGGTVILMFHSILPENDGLMCDEWAWSADKFSEFCKALKSDDSIRALTLEDIVAYNERKA